VKLGLASRVLQKDPAKVGDLLQQLQGDSQDALENLRDLARGIYPPLLADKGLVAALSAQARKATLPVEVDGNGLSRYPKDIEAALYFCSLEALQNVASTPGRRRRACGFALLTAGSSSGWRTTAGGSTRR
jgi:signal transduction histidine kinase